MSCLKNFYILEPNLQLRRHKGALEKDFLVINRTWHYMLSVEVKSSLSKINKTIDAMDQIASAKRLIEGWFGADLTSSGFGSGRSSPQQ
jgi:hypothetical protein